MKQCDYYLTTEWHKNEGDQAVLVSPKLGTSGKNCYLTYDIQLDGPNMTVELFVNSTSGTPKSISRISKFTAIPEIKNQNYKIQIFDCNVKSCICKFLLLTNSYPRFR